MTAMPAGQRAGSSSTRLTHLAAACASPQPKRKGMRCLQVKHFEGTREQSEAIGLSVPQDESHGAGQGGSEVSSTLACPQCAKEGRSKRQYGELQSAQLPLSDPGWNQSSSMPVCCLVHPRWPRLRPAPTAPTLALT